MCWSTSPNPTTANNKAVFATNGTGIFGIAATNLTPSTTYYIRAYATNSSGTAYSLEKSFKTVELTITDIDGNTYNVIEIGGTGHFWTKENLTTSKYRNGEPILTGLSNSQWQSTTSGAYSVYDNITSNNVTYGKLYNWYAVNDARGICPAGYHIPDNGDWAVLIQNCGYFPPTGNPGGAMKINFFME